MDCSQIRDLWLAGDVRIDTDVRQHLDGCVACSELFAGDGDLGKALAREADAEAPDVSQLWSEVDRSIAGETGLRAWLRSRKTSQRVLLAGLAGLLFTVIAALRLRPDFGAYPKAALFSSAASLQLGLVAIVWLALASLGRRKTRAWLPTALGWTGLIWPVALALSSGGGEPLAPGASAGDFWQRAASCFAYGSLLSLPLLGLIWLLDRDDRLTPAKLLLLSAATGLLANLELLFHCSIRRADHLLAGHASIGLGVAVTLALLLRALR